MLTTSNVSFSVFRANLFGFSRMEPHRTSHVRCVITSTNNSLDAGLAGQARRSSGQPVHLISLPWTTACGAIWKMSCMPKIGLKTLPHCKLGSWTSCRTCLRISYPTRQMPSTTGSVTALQLLEGILSTFWKATNGQTRGDQKSGNWSPSVIGRLSCKLLFCFLIFH